MEKKIKKSQEQVLADKLEKMLDERTKGVEEKYAQKFEDWKAEQKELIEKKAGIYNTDIQSDRKELQNRFRKTIFALKRNDYATLKDLSTDVDASGGYTVDEELRAEIHGLVTEYGVSRREMTVLTMSAPTIKLNKRGTDVSVYWTDEMGAKTSTDFTISQVSLTLNKLAAIVPMSDEILEDSEIDLVSYTASRVAEKIAEQEDEAAFNGDGSSTYGGYTGILSGAGNTVTMTGTTFASIDADDILDMIDALPTGHQANAKFYIHRTNMSHIRSLKDTTGAYIYQRPSESGPATIWGKPVVEVEVMPTSSDSAANTAFVLYADLKKSSYVGIKGGLKMDVSNQATVTSTESGDLNLFRQDMTALRFVERWGYVNLLTDAAVVLKTATASV
jgi:HK97 family phage major capsid protein